MEQVIVVGGGIIGMLSARELLDSGCSVTLIDQSRVGTEASWAGGGIISPLYPWQYDDAITALASWAQSCYPNLVQRLKEETGVDSEYNPCGMYMLDPEEHDQALTWARITNHVMDSVDINRVYQHEPHLHQCFQSALWMPAVANVRNPRLLKALAASLQENPHFTLRENERVTSIRIQNGRVQGVTTEQGDYSGEQVLITTGAWANQLTETVGLSLPVGPVKGQMLIFEPCPDLIHSILMYDGKYLIPRRDGRIIVGSTKEFVGFEKETTSQARKDLFEVAVGIVPRLSQLRIEKQWAGLRPGSPGGIPFIGPIKDIKGLYVNSGHFRNGLVLAPASAKLIADLMLGREPIVDPAPYDPNREVQPLEMI